MKLKVLATLFLLLLPIASAFGQTDADAQRLLEKIDDNLWSSSKHIEGRLIIDNGRRVRELSEESWMMGVTKGYSHYKSPARERGTKMLKIENKLWLYTPQTDRKILIAGHMLRQSMMGSDLSYEDMMEDVKVSEAYKATIEGFEDYEGKRVAVLRLTARDTSTTYQTRKVWADPDQFIILQEIRYAKSGKALKSVEFRDYFTVKNRLFPRRMVFRDLLKEDTKTTYVFDSIEFDVDIPERYFSQSILKR